MNPEIESATLPDLHTKETFMPALDRIGNHIMNVNGIRDVFVVDEAIKVQLFDLELEAEKRSFMGLGVTYNSGIRDVLRCSLVFAAITNMDFVWGFQSNIVLKRGEEVVGEEVRDPRRISELRAGGHVWFLHKNFAIHKDRIDFPRDIIQKRCHFELPALTPDECFPGLEVFGRYLYCFPSACGDVFLKGKYGKATDEWGVGTVLIGLEEPEQESSSRLCRHDDS